MRAQARRTERQLGEARWKAEQLQGENAHLRCLLGCCGTASTSASMTFPPTRRLSTAPTASAKAVDEFLMEEHVSCGALFVTQQRWSEPCTITRTGGGYKATTSSPCAYRAECSLTSKAGTRANAAWIPRAAAELLHRFAREHCGGTTSSAISALLLLLNEIFYAREMARLKVAKVCAERTCFAAQTRTALSSARTGWSHGEAGAGEAQDQQQHQPCCKYGPAESKFCSLAARQVREGQRRSLVSRSCCAAPAQEPQHFEVRTAARLPTRAAIRLVTRPARRDMDEALQESAGLRRELDNARCDYEQRTLLHSDRSLALADVCQASLQEAVAQLAAGAEGAVMQHSAAIDSIMGQHIQDLACVHEPCVRVQHGVCSSG